MPSTAQLRLGQAGPQERAGKRLLQEMFLCPHVRSVKKCGESNLESNTSKICYPFLHTWYTDMRCMYNLFRVYWTNIEDRKILVLKALQDIFDDCQRCIETTSPWLDIAFPSSHPPVKLQSDLMWSAADEILKPPRIWLQWPQAVILSAPSMTRWAHHVQRSDEQSQDTSITKAFDNVEVVSLLLWRQVCAFEFPGSQQAQSLRIHVPSTSNRRSKTERCWLIWEEGVTVFRKYVCGFLLLVACLHSWLMLISMLI